MSDQLRERICKLLNIRTMADDEAVGEAVEEAVEEGAKAGADLKSLLESLGVSDPEAAMKALPELSSAREKLVGVLAELDALMGADAAADAEMSDIDVGAAMSAQNYKGDGAKKALGAFRTQCVQAAIDTALSTKRKASKDDKAELGIVELREARKEGREKFLAEYGVKDTDKLHLGRPLVAGPNGKQLEPPKDGRALPIEERQDSDVTIDLRGVKGANLTEKLIAHLRKTETGFDKLPWERQVTRAAEVRRSAQLTT